MDFLLTPEVLKQMMKEAKNLHRGTSDQEKKLNIQCGIQYNILQKAAMDTS